MRGRGALLVIVAAVALVGGACGVDEDPGGGAGGIEVVASFYPLAEAAQRVGGDGVSVRNLTPAGVEPHDLELAPDDLEAIVTADLVVYAGAGFQPSVEEAIADAEGTVVDVLDAVQTLPPPDEEHEHEGGEPADEELSADPHVWLDPNLYSGIVESIADALAGVAPQRAGAFDAGAEALVGELGELDREFEQGLAECDTRTIVVNHAAFGYLAIAYDLEQHAISGVSPGSEPEPARLAELRDLVQDEGVTTIFTEELASPEVAETLAREAGVEVATLDPLEGLAQGRLDAGEDYRSVMRGNLAALEGALGCS